MFKTIITVLSLGLLALQDASAQQTITFESSDSKHSSSYNKKKKKKKELKATSLTIGTISAFNGYVPVYLERKATNFLSVQVGVGPTFRSLGNDFGQALYFEGETSEYVPVQGNDFHVDVFDQYYHYEHRNSLPGYMISVAPKIYFNKNIMDGFYIAPEISYKLFRYKALRADETKTNNDVASGFYGGASDQDDRIVPHTTANPINEYMACMDYTFTFGGHYQKRSGMVVGFSISAGARHFNAKRLDVYMNYDVSGSGVGYFRNTTRTYDGWKPLMLFNLTLGGCF